MFGKNMADGKSHLSVIYAMLSNIDKFYWHILVLQWKANVDKYVALYKSTSTNWFQQASNCKHCWIS